MKHNWKLLSRNEIADKAWNDCVGTSAKPLIYALTYYLDAVHPGWKGLVLSGEKGYKAVVPLTLRKLFGIPLLFQPIFAQQLGVFGLMNTNALELVSSKFPFINYQGNTCESIQGDRQTGVTWRTNIVKTLSSVDDVMKGYNQNRKRDIKKAIKAGLAISDIYDSHVIIDLFKATKGKETNSFKAKQFRRLHHLVETLKEHNQVHLSGVFDAKGTLVAGGIFLCYQRRITFLFGASGTEGKKCGAMTFLLHEMIKSYSGTYQLFDFEGSDIVGLKKYYSSFGGTEESYPLYYSNKLPWPLNMLIH